MNQRLFFGLIILTIALAGCVQNNPTGENTTGIILNGGTSSGMLIQGAACEVDSDCVYALNAYPIQRCVSQNCPPPENPNQPVQGDPAYEWMNGYLDECVNSVQLGGKNVQGEELLIDTRAATCACEPIPLAGTSVDGQKICRKKMVEETPTENTGI